MPRRNHVAHSIPAAPTGMGMSEWMMPALLLLCAMSACKRASTDSVVTPTPSSATLVFPQDLHVADASVNAFVQQMMETCAAGDYDAFCTLWTRNENEKPLDRREFERGWKAVRQIRVHELRPFRNEADGPLFYFLAAETDFDDSLARPSRKVELVIVNEQGQWRLRPAPRELRERLDSAARGTPHEPA